MFGSILERCYAIKKSTLTVDAKDPGNSSRVPNYSLFLYMIRKIRFKSILRLESVQPATEVHDDQKTVYIFYSP